VAAAGAKSAVSDFILLGVVVRIVVIILRT